MPKAEREIKIKRPSPLQGVFLISGFLVAEKVDAFTKFLLSISG
jgi:hypothetical protein